MQPVHQSDRSFGLMFAIALSAIAGVIWLVFETLQFGLLSVAAVFLVLALAAPAILFPFNRLWMWFGHKLGYVNNHILLGIFFYLLMTPMGLFMRLFGRDPMQRKLDPDATTYLSPVGRQNDSETMRDLF
jgi:hypothetical protein